LDGILYSDIIKGSYDGNLFVQFVDELTDIMNPYPGKNSVLVMDNCQIHHVPEVEEVCAKKYVSAHCFGQTNEAIRGIKLLYLPPYSPDYNPIEEFFLAYKAFLRRNAVDFQLAVESGEADAPFNFLYHAVEEVGKVNPRGWFQHAHYV
jgi:transposase